MIVLKHVKQIYRPTTYWATYFFQICLMPRKNKSLDKRPKLCMYMHFLSHLIGHYMCCRRHNVTSYLALQLSFPLICILLFLNPPQITWSFSSWQSPLCFIGKIDVFHKTIVCTPYSSCTIQDLTSFMDEFTIKWQVPNVTNETIFNFSWHPKASLVVASM
jgi:hypothetical protein